MEMDIERINRDLPPCPYCRAAAKLAYYKDAYGCMVYDVRCTNPECPTHCSMPQDTLERAVKEWENQRVYRQLRRWENDAWLE